MQIKLEMGILHRRIMPRFKILSKYGGIYFDTKGELLKTIPQDDD